MDVVVSAEPVADESLAYDVVVSAVKVGPVEDESAPASLSYSC